MRYLLKIAYDGTAYSGWQIQPNAISIQGEIEKALKTALQTPVTLQGSGRTDRGVHAKGQVAHFNVDAPIDTRRLLLSLNGLLPKAIRIMELEEVSDQFHARFSAKKKEYRYHFWTLPVVDPTVSAYRLHMRHSIDWELVKKGCAFFVGEKDFTTFANRRIRNQPIANPIRRIDRLDLVEQEGGARLEFVGNGFLYKMVRNIVGVLIEVGQKRRELSTIQELFDCKDRKQIGMPAPAHALFLQYVTY